MTEMIDPGRTTSTVKSEIKAFSTFQEEAWDGFGGWSNRAGDFVFGSAMHLTYGLRKNRKTLCQRHLLLTQ
jgi:hypothetical protein